MSVKSSAPHPQRQPQRPPQPQPFAYLQAPNAALYGRILGVFAAARERFIVHLRPEDVAADLRSGADVRPESAGQEESGKSGESEERTKPAESVEAVAAALEQLVGWGNLRADPDTGRVTSVEDFHRARFLYQLTRYGQAALRAVAVYDEALGRRGQLQSVALADIAEQLGALLVLAGEEDPDPARAHLALLGLADRFGSLADNAQAFMTSLRRTIDFRDGDEEAFIAYKDRLVEYIERFIADLANRGAQIADLLTRLNAAGVHRLLRAAAQREAGDAVPEAEGAVEGAAEADGSTGGQQVDGQDGGQDGGQVDGQAGGRDVEQARQAAAAAALTVWENRWRGLTDWFLSRGSRQPSQAKLLRSAAVSAITGLVNTVAALNERRGGRSDRSADFRALARFFAQAPDEGAAHRLWRAAFALTPARHLTVDAATEAAWQEAELPGSTLWAQAPPLEISPRLRETGSYERRGRPNQVADRSESRRLLAEQVEREAAQTAAARARLATDGPVLLSDLAGPGGLDPQVFRLFLAVLGDALAARVPGESESSAVTGDGTMEIRLKLLDPDSVVRVPTADGVLSGPEHVLEIVDLAPEGSPATSGTSQAAPVPASTETKREPERATEREMEREIERAMGR